MSDNLKNNFDDCMQLINSINVDANHKTYENLSCKFTPSDDTATIEHDEQYKNVDAKEKVFIFNDELVSNSVIFECNGDAGNSGKTDITTTENLVDSLKNKEVKQTVVNTAVAIDNFQKVLLTSKNEIIENSASDVTEIPTRSRETLEIDMSDCKQETDLLNNVATFSNVDEKSQSKFNVDVKCQAINDKNTRMMIETIDLVDKGNEKEIESFSDISFKCLQQATASTDEVKNKESNTTSVVEFNSISMQVSEEISHVNSENECSQTAEFKINTENNSKSAADSLNNLTIFKGEEKNSESKLSPNLSESLNMQVESEAIEVVSELVNRLTEKDKVTSKVSESENNQVTVMPEEDLNATVSTQKTKKYREIEETWTDDDDSSSSSSSSGSSSDSDFFQMIVESSGPKNVPEIKTRGELGLDDLPPIEDLTITIPKEEMMLIGVVHAVVDKLVVIHALKDMKPLDIDSVLFLTHERPLGRVYDVFGPVVEPFYCVRFNNTEDIKEKLVEIGAYVFFAPKKEDITSYVFVDELQKEKGSDASWKFNNEPPEEFLDFSDDEQEKAARRNKMIKNRNQRFSSSSDSAAKRPSLMSDSDSQQNSNYRSAHDEPASYRNNMNVSRAPFSRSYSSRPLPPPSPIASNVFSGSRFPRSYPSHPPSSSTPSASSVFNGSRFSRPYPSHLSLSPTPSISSVYETPRVIPYSSSYPSHPPPSPAASVSSVLEAPRFIPYSSPFSYPPPSPSPTVSVIAAPSFSPVSNPYFPPPPSPTPSVCSMMSVAVRAQTQNSLSTFRQPHPPYPQQPRASSFAQHPRSFSPQIAPQRYLTSSSNLQSQFSSTVSPQQSASPIMLQSRQQSLLQVSFPPQNAIQRPTLPPQHVIPAFPLQTQRPALSPAMPYQQTHVFGQVTLMSPIATLHPSLPPPPPPPVNMQSFSTPPPISMQSFMHSPGPHVPPQYPLTVQIPNLNSSPVPAVNNMIQRGQPPLY